jgi:hypothetical protein
VGQSPAQILLARNYGFRSVGRKKTFAVADLIAILTQPNVVGRYIYCTYLPMGLSRRCRRVSSMILSADNVDDDYQIFIIE